jgi:hypothetical protein
MRKVKDKEGVIFELVTDSSVKESSRRKKSVLYVTEIINNKMNQHNVYPDNGVVGFISTIDSMSFFWGMVIEQYIKENINEYK